MQKCNTHELNWIKFKLSQNVVYYPVNWKQLNEYTVYMYYVVRFTYLYKPMAYKDSIFMKVIILHPLHLSSHEL